MLGYSQEIIKMNAYGFTFSKIEESVPSMKPVDILITIKGMRFIIYSNTKQIYDAISSRVVDNDGDEWVFYECIDETGKQINIYLNINKDNQCMFVVNNDNYAWSYLCKFLE